MQDTSIKTKTQSAMDDINLLFSRELEANPYLFRDESNFADFSLLMYHGRWEPWDFFLLRREAHEMITAPTGQGLLCMEHLKERWKKTGMIPYPHQIRAALKVIYEMHGRAILADEVGLGKTIEAGLIIKEYILSGLIKNFLILTPASLCRQWQSELHEKFALWSTIVRKPADWKHENFLIASIDTAKKEPHAGEALLKYYDMVVIDEAHKLKNSRTQNWQFVQQLRKKFFLLLTATPLQNDLKELFNLITLLRPGQLGHYRQFQSNFMQKKRVVKNPHRLKELIGEVMIRNRRREVLQDFPKRLVKAIPVELDPAEYALYQKIVKFIKTRYNAASHHANILPLITLQREICSSTYAAAFTLDKMIKSEEDPAIRDQLAELLNECVKIPANNKIRVLVETITSIPSKVIVFTEFIATQKYIRYCLQQAGIQSISFDGTLSSGKKEYVKLNFRNNPQIKVMVATESGGEGINLQFCNHLINFDLPWNPMRIEQRIGRVHRLGQVNDVYIYNLSTRGTIEEHIVQLLQEKLNLFQIIVENADELLYMQKELAFEAKMIKIIMEADVQDAISEKFDEIAREFLARRKAGRSANGEWFY